ncbi:hypothetical protein EVAR_16386_1 [Eumeta japonica]|uniref:Uncharacterized protein n=1 Tax=Eumeta variegata TaxID=151549 RepID=A0A4C1VUT2_EUMVA|nr:hypothetical protein EVAR_16386_1 [Eumeta japonica]
MDTARADPISGSMEARRGAAVSADAARTCAAVRPPLVFFADRFAFSQAHPQEIVDSHIHQGARSVKTTNTTSLSGPLSCNGQRVTKTFLRQPQTTTDRHVCQMSQTNHHQH